MFLFLVVVIWVMGVDEKVLRALSNEYRKKIVEYLYNSGSAGYSELMKAAGFNIGESGRFSYHLKKLIDAGLVKQLPDGKYALTPLGSRVAGIMHEEAYESPSIIDTIEGFLERINQKKFVTGNLLVYTGLAFSVVGGLKTVLSLINYPAKIELLGNTIYYVPDPKISLIIFTIGAISLLAGLLMLKKLFPKAHLLELLVYQKYSYLLLSRSTFLRKYFIAYIMVSIVWVLLIFIPF